MPKHYEYRSGGRSALNIAALAILLLFVLWAARHGAGLGLWMLWAITTAALAHQLLAHPVAGSRIGATRWITFIDRRRRIIALKKIRKVTLTRRKGTRYACTVHLLDRSEIRIPAACLPPAANLARALRRHGIRLDIVHEAKQPKPRAPNGAPPAAEGEDGGIPAPRSGSLRLRSAHSAQ